MYQGKICRLYAEGEIIQGTPETGDILLTKTQCFYYHGTEICWKLLKVTKTDRQIFEDILNGPNKVKVKVISIDLDKTRVQEKLAIWEKI